MGLKPKKLSIMSPKGTRAESLSMHAFGFPQILQRRRRRMGLSQEDLAGQLGVSKITIHRWEHGQAYPYPHCQKLLCKCLKTSHDELFPDVPARLSTRQSASLESVTRDESIMESLNEIEVATRESLLINGVSEEESSLAAEKLQLERLEIQKKSLDNALGIANQLIDTAYPELEASEKAALLVELLPDLLPLPEGHVIKTFLRKAASESSFWHKKDDKTSDCSIRAVI